MGQGCEGSREFSFAGRAGARSNKFLLARTQSPLQGSPIVMCGSITETSLETHDRSRGRWVITPNIGTAPLAAPSNNPISTAQKIAGGHMGTLTP
jgi:hypothetical protein